ncbi:transcriptional regulator [Halosimplex rubrum]|uniref:Transcriptional regulator n=1 Tax=Halosimplex rubrum TaxID=869889 RepID=A0A7D5TNL4_9EURY|nr:transcriptional regulator [Halosimplex rubrum]QLH77394.1 transcriptional regulator [Halosimplex rubrum]
MRNDDGGDASRLFGALADRNRRVVLYYLREHESASLETFADLVTGWTEAGPGPDRSVAHDDVRIGLHHVHLPALDAAGLLEYDPDGGRVALAELSAAEAAVLDAAMRADATDAAVDLERLLAAAGGAGADDGG